MIRLMIVDDSGFMRLAIKKMLEKHAAIKVVAEATNANDAVRLAKQHKPDVITMDIEMPGGSGIEAARTIMRESPTVIIMVSSLTAMGASATIEALNAGAVDYIPKASSFVSLDITKIESELLRKIFYWAEHSKKVLPHGDKQLEPVESASVRARFSNLKPRVIVIGASTGGPKVIPEIFKEVKKLSVPVVIALHMPPIYTESFARHMASSTGHHVVEGADKMILRGGMVVIAPGGKDSMIQQDGNDLVLKVVSPRKEYSIHPSVNCLFRSAVAETKKIAGIILTGMGEDGLEGAMDFRKYGLPLVAQDKASSLVYGMPRAVVESGLATSVLGINGISRKINEWGCGSGVSDNG